MLQGLMYNLLSIKKARKLTLVFFVLFLLALSAPFTAVHAQGGDTLGVKPVAETIALSGLDIRVIVAKIIRAALSLLGIVAVVIVLYAGFLWMTSGGNDEQIGKAKQWLKNGVIGLAIILSAFAIVQFVLSKLAGGTGLAGGDGSGRPPVVVQGRLNGGALGSIIEDHYPEHRAKDIPRNTKIFVTFAESMDPSTLVLDTNNPDVPGNPNGVMGDCAQRGETYICDTLNDDNIKISIRGQEEAGPFVTDVETTMTQDRRTFVFKPRAPLGSSLEDVSYTVFLGSGLKRADGSPAFPGGRIGEDSYEWYFTVGTFLDLSPPFVESFAPGRSPVQKNRLIQITFNEAMDPAFISGPSDKTPFSRVDQRGVAAPEPIAGRFEVSNGYRTVTFVPSEACGENTCGQTIFCLPGDADVQVLYFTAFLKDPQLSEAVPGSGVVDAADNALDGGGDRGSGGVKGKAEGPPEGSVRNPDRTPSISPADPGVDNFFLRFRTTNEMDLTPPMVRRFAPEASTEDLDRSSSSSVHFSEEMYYPSLVQYSRIVAEDGALIPYVRRMTLLDSAALEPYTELVLKPGDELPADTIFNSRLQSDIQDLGQNCFFPSVVNYPVATQCRSVSEGGQISRDRASCCNGSAEDAVTCTFE